MTVHKIGKQVTSSEGYARWAATYDAADNPMTAMVDRVLATSQRTLQGRKVLELGCGTGHNAQRILEMGAIQYTGIDASDEMLAMAKQRWDGAPSVNFMHGDIALPPTNSAPRLGAYFAGVGAPRRLDSAPANRPVCGW